MRMAKPINKGERPHKRDDEGESRPKEAMAIPVTDVAKSTHLM
jgi:hypothetical protein